MRSIALTFVRLFLFTGSVVLPVKALALNALSLTAVFAALVRIFQDGHLAGPLVFTPTPDRHLDDPADLGHRLRAVHGL